MQTRLDLGVILRLVLPLILAPLFMISIAPVKAQQALRLASQAMKDGDAAQAAFQLEQAAQYYPWRSDLWEQAGLQAVRAGKYEAALRSFEQVRLQAGLSTTGLIALGDAERGLGNATGALEAWEQALKQGGHAEEIYQRRLEVFSEQKNFEAMLLELQALAATNPTHAGYHYQAGLLLAASQPERALAYLEQAALLDTNLSGPVRVILRSIRLGRVEAEPAFSFLAVGRGLAGIGEWELAVQAFQRAAAARPDYAEAWAFLAEAYQHTGSETEAALALPALETALTLDPDSVAANSLAALYYQRAEEHEQALIYLNAAAQADPMNPTWQAEIGRSTALLGDPAAAIVYYQQAVDLAPWNPLYWKIMAEFSLLYQVQVREIALPAARQAVSLAPEDPQALDLMGQTLFFMEDYAGAERFLLRALQADPSYAPAHLHMGMTYLISGPSQEALAALQQAIRLEPSSPTANLAQRLIERYFRE